MEGMLSDYKFEHVWKLLNVHQVAKILGMTEQNLRKMIRERKIRSYYIAGRYMLREWDVQHWIEDHLNEKPNCGRPKRGGQA